MKRFLKYILFLLFMSHANLVIADVNTPNNKLLSNKKHMQLLDEISRSDEEIERVAKEYESVAINKMLQQMHEGIKPDPILGGGQTEEIYKDFLVTEYAKIISDNGGIGIRESIIRDMKKINNPNQGRIYDQHK